MKLLWWRTWPRQPGTFVVKGDTVGIVVISSITVTNNPVVNGQPATATIVIHFAQPLPDDRYTVTINGANILDLAGNELMGFSNATEPNGSPTFASGGTAGSFNARFTVDSRPEIGTYCQGNQFIDINGNGVFDPTPLDNDQTNADLTFHLGMGSDSVFAGNFSAAGTSANGFSKLAAYGQVNGVYRFLIDLTGTGVPSITEVSGLQINGLPVAGRFNPSINADELAVFDGQGNWYIDFNHTNNLSSSSLVVHDGLTGYPIVGDFDGNGSIDLATYRPDLNEFFFDLNPLGGGPHVLTTLTFQCPGQIVRPVAADMNMDGVTDIGLFSADPSAPSPGLGQWRFLISSGTPVPGTINTFNHPFSPAPLGTDLYYQFGNANNLPIVGNFDPPTSTTPADSTAGITAAYEQFLERAPDAGALTYWTQQIQSGGISYSTFVGSLLGSQEYYSLHGGTPTGFVTGLYEQLLNRDPAASEAAYWTGQLANGASLTQLATTLASSPEAISQQGTLTQQFRSEVGTWVGHLYQDVLHRTGTTGETQYWASQVTSGHLSRDQVVNSLVNSDEALTYTIQGYYHQYLGANRTLDAGGLNYWLTTLHNGDRLEDVLAGVLSSQEYYNNHGGTDKSFVDGLYQSMFSRPADAGDLYWVGQLQGSSRTAVVRDFLSMPEYQKGLIDGWYEAFLNRPADAGGEQSFLNLMAGGWTQEQVEDALLVSSEYFHRPS